MAGPYRFGWPGRRGELWSSSIDPGPEHRLLYSPYAPPAAPPQHHGPTPFYRPLGGLTTAAIIAIVFTVPVHLATNGLVMAVDPGAGGDEASLPAAFALLGAAAITVAVNLAACIIFLIWLHRAATNVRAFGHQGLEFTPGWCVGWWFVPFANLVKPLRAMQEVWRASDPDALGGGYDWTWRTSPVAPTMGAWWGAWIVSGFLDRISARIDDPATGGAIGVTAALVSGVAALLLVPIMRQLAARQEASWAKLHARPGAAQPYDYRAA